MGKYGENREHKIEQYRHTMMISHQTVVALFLILKSIREVGSG